MPALILADFFLGETADAEASGWPRLPALERWLALADREPATSGWRDWLAGQLGLPVGHAPAAMAAAGAINASSAGGNTPVEYWLATPVHWVAGLDTVRLHPRGLLRLSRDEKLTLRREFAEVLGDDGSDAGAALQVLPGRDFLLATMPGTSGIATGSTDPARWLGLAPDAGMPAGPAAASLRRRWAEIEMWLNGSAVNREREARGEPAVSALWLWGGASGHDVPAIAAAATAAAVDAEALTCAATTAGVKIPSGALAADDSWLFAALRLAARTPMSVSVVSAAGHAQAPDMAALHAAEVEPRMAAWERGELSALTLVANDRCWILRRAHRWRRWRRLRPWWEAMTAC